MATTWFNWGILGEKKPNGKVHGETILTCGTNAVREKSTSEWKLSRVKPLKLVRPTEFSGCHSMTSTWTSLTSISAAFSTKNTQNFSQSQNGARQMLPQVGVLTTPPLVSTRKWNYLSSLKTKPLKRSCNSMFKGWAARTIEWVSGLKSMTLAAKK